MVQVSETTEQMQTVARLWQEHRQASFPDSLRSAKFAGMYVWPLDLYTAGCVLHWLDNGCTLDLGNCRIVQSCIEDLARVLPEIVEPAAAQYCQRLHELAVLVAGDLSHTT